MKLKEIFRYEFSYQLRHFSTYAFFLVLFAIAYFMIGNYLEQAIEGGYYVNAPFIIATVSVFTCMFWLLICPAIAGEAAARDIHTRMYLLIFTSPVKKATYLGGKFLAALVINSLILLAIPIGIVFATHASGMDNEAVGPFRLSAYLTAYLFITFPNVFVATAAQFMCSVIKRRSGAGYLIGGAFFVGTYVITFAFANMELAKVLDPVGFNMFVNEVPLAWTPIELNSRLITLEGLFLVNRLLWAGIGIGFLFITYSRFHFSYPVNIRRDSEKDKIKIAAQHSPLRYLKVLGNSIVAPEAKKSFNFQAKLKQALSVAESSFLTIMKRGGGFIMLILVALITLLITGEKMDKSDVPLLAESWKVLSTLTVPLGSVGMPWIFIVILIAFYAGELVWKEREAGLNDISNATPTSNWVFLSGKFFGLAAFLLSWIIILIIVGVSIQVISGNFDFNLPLYLKILIGFQFMDYLMFALLAFFAHIIINQKYVGHLVVLLSYGFLAFAPKLGADNKLLIFGSDSGWSYTAMQGFSDLKLWMLFKFYWIGWSILLLVIGNLLWVRGRDLNIDKRFLIAAGRVSPTIKWASIAAFILIITCGGFIFYNTRVLNTYKSITEIKKYKADYEKQFARYNKIPQPQLTRTELNVEIYPKQRKVEIVGIYHLVNNHAVSVDSIHLTPVQGVDISRIAFDHPADLVFDDKELGYRIYKLRKPVQPGDSIKMEFQLSHENDDLSGKNSSKFVVNNGTLFRNYQLLPAIGYQSFLELKDKVDRQDYNLSPKPANDPLESIKAHDEQNIWDQRVKVEAVVGTAADQIAVAPGILQDSWSLDDRRYFKYITNAPIRNEYAFFSADYQIEEEQWKNVNIQIMHHPDHNKNLNGMIAGIKKSLEYFSKNFGPYPYNQIRFVEHPGAGYVLHAAPINIDYMEGFSYMNPEADEREFNFVFAIVAHEVAHQWWGNLLNPANVQGSGILSESLAWYSGIKVMENTYGHSHLMNLLDLLRQEYEKPMSRADVPLIKGNESFHVYRKGPLTLYTISEYIGEDSTNIALHRLFEKYGNPHPPFATTLNLYEEIKAVTPDSLKYLINDLFIKNTFWDLETTEATAEQTKSGDWKVKLQVKASKEVVDEVGLKTELQMNDWIEVGVYGPSKEAGRMGEVLYLRKHKIKSGQQTIVITVPKEPGHAGVDPNQLLDRDPDDNFGILSGDGFAKKGISFN